MPIALAFGDRAHDLLDLLLVGRERRADELGGEMRLEVGRLVRDERVRGRVRLVEAVARELLEQVEDLAGLAAVVAETLGAVDEGALLLGHLLGLLLAHRAAQEIGAAERVARERAGDLHDLLLVDDDAVRRP
jgi:hypothetical protein